MRFWENNTPLMCAAMSAAQNDVSPPYSALNTALFAAVNACSAPHSLYWLHCSSRDQSKKGSSCDAWSTSFFNPTDSPSECAVFAIHSLNVN